MSNKLESVVFIRLENPVEDAAVDIEYLTLLLFVDPTADSVVLAGGLFVDVVTVPLPTVDKGIVPVGSNPLDLFRLASGHPEALLSIYLSIQFLLLLSFLPSVGEKFSGRMTRPVTSRNRTPLKKENTILENLFCSSKLVLDSSSH